MNTIDDEVRLCYIFILQENRPMKNWWADESGIYVAVLQSHDKPIATATYLLEAK